MEEKEDTLQDLKNDYKENDIIQKSCQNDFKTQLENGLGENMLNILNKEKLEENTMSQTTWQRIKDNFKKIMKS